MPLMTTPNLRAADDFYEALIRAHQDLEIQQSHALNAKLVLILANHVGDMDVLQQAIDEALRNTLGSAGVRKTEDSTMAEAAAYVNQ